MYYRFCFINIYLIFLLQVDRLIKSSLEFNPYIYNTGMAGCLTDELSVWV